MNGGVSAEKIDFVIAGGQKCGTTSLAEQLQQLSEIAFCAEKEPHFFSKTQNPEKNLEKYLMLYSPRSGQMLGEASTSYSFTEEYPETPKRLHSHNQNLKIIFLLRDPVERIESHFNHRLRSGVIKHNVLDSIGTHPCFLERSRYYRQIKAYCAYFPVSQIKVISFDAYTSKPIDTLKEICSFLGVSADELEDLDFSPSNVSDGSLKLSSLPFSKLLFRSLERVPFSYKLARHVPVKVRFSSALKRLLWQALEEETLKLAEFEIDVNRWRKRYEFNSKSRL